MTIFGSDISHFDSPDTRKMFSQGIVFQTHKAGGDADDAELNDWWDYVKGYRGTVLLGAYWVLYPGTPAARADRFLARLDSQCPGWRDGPFILQADCEKWNGDAGTVPSVSEINAFCDRLAERLPKLNPIAYAPEWVYGAKVAALRYPLWASSYVNGTGTPQHLYPGDSSSRWGAYGGREPSVLQFTSSATIGGQTTCDANAFRGTLDELTALLAPGWEIDMDLTKQNLDDIAQAVASKLHTDYTVTPPSGLAKDQTASEQRIVKAVTTAVNDASVDESAIVAGVLAGLDPAQIAAAIPSDLAAKVADELARRLGSAPAL